MDERVSTPVLGPVSYVDKAKTIAYGTFFFVYVQVMYTVPSERNPRVRLGRTQ